MQRLSRRSAIAAGSAAMIAAPWVVRAQGAWPNKPIRFIVNFAPGGGSDNAARPFAERLSRVLGQQVIVENRGGASGAIGADAVIKSPPDGYTFLATPSLTLVILPHLRKLTFDPLKDLVPVAVMAEGALLIATHPTVPVNTLQELVAHAKANPGKLSWGTAGVGSYGHLICETFKHHAGVDILHVPYRATGEALADFLAGVSQIQSDPVTLPHIAAGRAKLMSVFGRQRRPDYPDIPMTREIYPEMDHVVWFALLAPPGTPKEIVEQMSAAVQKVGAEEDLKKTMFELALTPAPTTPDEMAKLMADDHAKYGKIIRHAGIKAE
jgi:tripartite-type tricarboxylate transporter receptor subunit TctC